MKVRKFTNWRKMFIAIWLSWMVIAPGGAAAEEVGDAAPLVSLNVIDGEVRDVLAALAHLGNVNILMDASAEGKITVQIDSLELYTALDLITKVKNLAYYRMNDTIVVGSKEMLHKNFGGLHIFALNFADPIAAATAATLALGEEGIQKFDLGDKKNDIITVIDTAKTRKIDYNISKRLAIDTATNSLLFYGTDAEADIIRSLLEQIDIPYEQISLEAKVVAIQNDAAKNLGIEWTWSKLPQYPKRETEIESVETTVEVDGQMQTTTEQRPKDTTTRSWPEGSSTAGVIRFGRGPEGVPFEFYYTAQLNALILDGKANILARPNIMTINGQEAVINIGGEIPVPTVSVTNATTTTSVVYREAGIILRYTPRINKGGFITADVHTEVSSPVYVPDVKAYRFNKRSADTAVRLKDGETMVIGGLIGSEESKSISKIPFLSDLPILGRFFSNVRNGKSESEVMIFLTACIVK